MTRTPSAQTIAACALRRCLQHLSDHGESSTSLYGDEFEDSETEHYKFALRLPMFSSSGPNGPIERPITVLSCEVDSRDLLDQTQYDANGLVDEEGDQFPGLEVRDAIPLLRHSFGPCQTQSDFNALKSQLTDLIEMHHAGSHWTVELTVGGPRNIYFQATGGSNDEWVDMTSVERSPGEDLEVLPSLRPAWYSERETVSLPSKTSHIGPLTTKPSLRDGKYDSADLPHELWNSRVWPPIGEEESDQATQPAGESAQATEPSEEEDAVTHSHSSGPDPGTTESFIAPPEKSDVDGSHNVGSTSGPRGGTGDPRGQKRRHSP